MGANIAAAAMLRNFLFVRNLRTCGVRSCSTGAAPFSVRADGGEAPDPVSTEVLAVDGPGVVLAEERVRSVSWGLGSYLLIVSLLLFMQVSRE
jgi:hypothetical protein